MGTTKDFGDRGEALAAAFLEAAGYEIVERNLRQRHDEIDIIAREGGDWVFVEVKTRRSMYGTAAAAVTPAKVRRMARGAAAYLRQRGLETEPMRFDVVAIAWVAGGEPEVEILRDAVHPGSLERGGGARGGTDWASGGARGGVRRRSGW